MTLYWCMYNNFYGFFLLNYILHSFYCTWPITCPWFILSSTDQYFHIIQLKGFQWFYQIIQVGWQICGSSFPHYYYSPPIFISLFSIFIAQLSSILGHFWCQITCFLKISHAVFSLTILLEDEIYWLTSTIHVNFSHLVIIKRIIIQQYGNKLCCISPKIYHCKCYCLVDLVYCIIESSIMHYL